MILYVSPSKTITKCFSIVVWIENELLLFSSNFQLARAMAHHCAASARQSAPTARLPRAYGARGLVGAPRVHCRRTTSAALSCTRGHERTRSVGKRDETLRFLLDGPVPSRRRQAATCAQARSGRSRVDYVEGLCLRRRQRSLPAVRWCLRRAGGGVRGGHRCRGAPTARDLRRVRPLHRQQRVEGAREPRAKHRLGEHGHARRARRPWSPGGGAGEGAAFSGGGCVARCAAALRCLLCVAGIVPPLAAAHAPSHRAKNKARTKVP